VSDALIGARWEIGTTVLSGAELRIPCRRFEVRMNDQLFPRLHRSVAAWNLLTNRRPTSTHEISREALGKEMLTVFNGTL
jgi:hypothetical protein